MCNADLSSYYSPIYSRSSYTPSSNQGTTGLQYFSNSPTHEGQMWSPSNTAELASAAGYASPPRGGLPAFQRLTSTASLHYAPTPRTTNHYNYGSQVSSDIFYAYFVCVHTHNPTIHYRECLLKCFICHCRTLGAIMSRLPTAHQP